MACAERSSKQKGIDEGKREKKRVLLLWAKK